MKTYQMGPTKTDRKEHQCTSDVATICAGHLRAGGVRPRRFCSAWRVFASLFKAELVRNKGPWTGIDDLEIAVAEYVDWSATDGCTARSGSSHPPSTRPSTTVRTPPRHPPRWHYRVSTKPGARHPSTRPQLHPQLRRVDDPSREAEPVAEDDPEPVRRLVRRLGVRPGPPWLQSVGAALLRRAETSVYRRPPSTVQGKTSRNIQLGMTGCRGN